MNLLSIFQTISTNIKAILIGAGIASMIGSSLYIRGCQDGEKRMDARWRTQIATSKSVEVRRDTVVKYIPQPQAHGTAHGTSVEPSKDYQRAIDSLKVLLETKNATLEDVLKPYNMTIETPAIGKLEITCLPALREITWIHFPPPMKIETVTIEKEKLVLAPHSIWGTVRDVGLGVVGGALITYIVIQASH